MASADTKAAAQAFSKLIEYDPIAKDIASRRGELISNIKEQLRKTILNLDPSDTLSFRLYQENKEVRIVRGFLSLEYIKTLLSFLQKKKYHGYKVDSYITPIVLTVVEQCLVKFYSSNEIQAVISLHISQQIKDNKIIGALIRGEITDESKRKLVSILESQIGKQLAHILIFFCSTAIGQQVISFIHAHVSAGMMSALAHQLGAAISHSVIAGTLKSTIISLMGHVGISALIHTKIGLIIAAFLATIGIAGKAAVFLFILAPIVFGVLAYQYHKFPEKLANKLPPEVSSIVNSKFEEITIKVLQELTSSSFYHLFENAIREPITKKIGDQRINDDLDPYHNYNGSHPPEIEQHKYRLSLAAKEKAEINEYIEAARIKLELAEICRFQGKDGDAYMLEVSAHKLIEKAAVDQNRYYESSNILKDWALRLRKQGNEKDAYLLELTANEYAKKII